MRIAINHLTRMKPGYICVAGIDLDTGRHVRPVLAGRLPRSLLRQEGGVFEIGMVVDLGEVRPVGKAPETEDVSFEIKNTRIVDTLDDKQFWAVIGRSARDSFNEIFGDDLQPHGRGLAVSVNHGSASLGCLRTNTTPVLITAEYFGKESLRVRISDAGKEFGLSVTDIRLYEKDQVTLNHAEIQRVTQLLRKGKESLLSVGLSRPWLKPGDNEPRHWLQLNNIHLKTNLS